MYFAFEKYVDALIGIYRKNVVSEKKQISKEQEQSKKDLSTICDCESYCDKYKPTKSFLNFWPTNNKDENNKVNIDEPKKKSTNMFGAVLTLFGKKDSENKKEKVDPVIEPEQPKVEQPQVEQLQVEQPQAEQPQAEQPQVEQPQPQIGQLQVEQLQPQPQPHVEPPKVEQPQLQIGQLQPQPQLQVEQQPQIQDNELSEKKEDVVQEINETNIIESETHEFQLLKVKNKYLY